MIKKIVLPLILLSTSVQAATLDQILRDSLSYSSNFDGVEEDIQAELHRLDVRKGALRPTLSLDFESGWARTDNNSTRNRASRAEGDRRSVDLWENTATLTLKQPLYKGGELSANIEAQSSRVSREKFALQEEKQDVVLQIILTYVDFQTAKALKNLALNNVTKHQIFLAQMKERLSYRVGTNAEVFQAETRLEQSKDQLKLVENDIDQSLIVLNRFLPEPIRNIDEFPLDVKNEENEELLLEQILQNNLSLGGLHLEVDEAMSRVEAAKGRYLPEVSFEMEATRDEHTDGTANSSSDMRAVMKVDYDIYNGGRDVAAVKELKYRLSSKKTQLGNLKNRVRTEGEQLITSLQFLGTRQNILSKQVSGLESLRKDYREEFKVGKRTLLDVLNTENELFFTQQELARVQGEILRTRLQIKALKGELLEWIDNHILL